MQWDNIKALLAVGRSGSLTAAAHLLGVDQTTVGRKLSALEAELGSILFVRSKAGFALTEAGQAAMARAEEIELAANALKDDISRTQKGAVGTVRIAGNAWTLARLIRNDLAGVMRKNPGIDIRMVSLSPQSRVRGEASVGLWFEAEPGPGEYTIKLGEVPYAVYRARTAPQDQTDWVAFYDENAERAVIGRAIARLKSPQDKTRFVATDAALLHTAVEAGLGLGLLPMCMGEEDPNLIRASQGEPELIRTLNIHLHPDTVESRRIQAVMKWLRSVFERTFLPQQEP